MSKHVLMYQPLRKMRNALIILVPLTKALFALGKSSRLGTPLLPSMLIIILSAIPNQYSILLNNSHLIYTFILCFCSSYYFYLAFSYIYFIILHAIFIRQRLQTDGRKLMLLCKIFLACGRFYLLNMSHPSYTSIFLKFVFS